MRRSSRAAWTARAFLSIEETAVLLGISRATLYRSVHRGDFPMPVVRLNGRMRVPRRAVERLMEGTVSPTLSQPGASGGGTPSASDVCPTCGTASTTSPPKRTPMCSAARRSSSSSPSV
jgi:excisionase family DNA binding protein